MSNAKFFETGRTTGPDVKKMREKFKPLNPGDLIKYDDVSSIISESKSTSRFRTVLSAFRKALWREENILFESVPNVGIVVCDNQQRISNTSRIMTSGLRRIAKSGSIAQKTSEEGLTEDEKRRRNHIVNLGATITTLARTEAQKIRWNVKETKQIAA